MSKQIKYWDDIIDQYRASGLSQLAFCKQNELSINQFRYRWYLDNLAEKVKAKTVVLEKTSLLNTFESVIIARPSSAPKDETSNIAELAIHLPNQIRCNVKMDLRTHAFAVLLKQLVRLC